jgi:oligogalacturonide lyase
VKPGDLVLIQFGHNDGGAINDTSRARGSIRGVGEESQEIDNLLTGKHEVVHSYGWYLRKFISDARSKGATPIVVTPVPRNIWVDGAVVRNKKDYAGWAEEVARAEGTPLIDLNELVAREYDALGPERVKSFFPHDHTHTNLEGAELTAQVAVRALASLPGSPVGAYLAKTAYPLSPERDRVPDVLPRLETGSRTPMPLAWIDRDTGHRVVRLTRREGTNQSFYFNNNPFIPQRADEGDEMVFYGSTAEGRQLFTVNLKTLRNRQLTHRAGGVSGEIVAPRHREAVYQSGDSVFATSVDDATTRLLYVFPAGFDASISTLNADETLLAGLKAGPEVRAIKEKYPTKGEYFNRIFAAHPPYDLFVVDLRKGGAPKVIHHEDTWLGHVQFSPTDPNLLMFCHEGPWHLVDRIWTIDVRGGSPPRLMHQRTVDREIAGHEFFGPDGTLWYDLQIPRGVTFFLAGTNPTSGRTSRYQMTRDEWSIHFNASPDGRLFACDGGDSTQVARAKDGRWIYLFRPDGERLRSERLVNMSHHGYRPLEPNVHFSPDGRWVIFRSDFGGETESYAVEVARTESTSAR